MNKDKLAKIQKIATAVTSFVAGLGASTIARRLIKNNVSPTGKITMITIPVATFFIAEFAGVKVEKYARGYITKSVNEIRDAWKRGAGSTVTEL